MKGGNEPKQIVSPFLHVPHFAFASFPILLVCVRIEPCVALIIACTLCIVGGLPV